MKSGTKEISVCSVSFLSGKRRRTMLPMYYFLLFLPLLISCVKDRDFKAPKEDCLENLEANIPLSDVKKLYTGTTFQIQEDWIVEGYVISSDKAGNFYSSLHFQDAPENPTGGLQIEIEMRDSHLFYPIGAKILVRLKGLYLGMSKGVYKIGGVFASFGNSSVGRLPTHAIADHIFVECGGGIDMRPRPITLSQLDTSYVNTLVRLQNVEISSEEVGLNFADFEASTWRTLLDCEDNAIGLLNSGYADFWNQSLPNGLGKITGVLLREKNDFYVVVRDLNDVELTGERCEDLIDEFTSDQVFISELADPDNNTGARFVELYNAAEEHMPLKGWSLRRYTNANTEVGSIIDLSGNLLEAGKTLVISPNAAEFEAIYGFAPNVAVGTNSPADSNGDDNLELVDPFGKVIDMFGRIGEDGSGTNHEFEDGRALRNINIVKGNPIFDASEWTIYNDTGGQGTVQMPQNAPADFSPGQR